MPKKSTCLPSFRNGSNLKGNKLLFTGTKSTPSRVESFPEWIMGRRKENRRPGKGFFSLHRTVENVPLVSNVLDLCIIQVLSE